MSTLAVTNLKHESATGNNIVLASDGTATFAEVISASKGIAFPATQVSSANANTLDDYEEGTWTPVLAFGGASVSMTHDTQSGFYTKVGNLVTANCYISLTNKGTSTGDATITGLPFTSNNTFGNFNAAAMTFNVISFADFPSCALINNQSSLQLREITNAGVFSFLDNTNFANNSNIIITISYQV
jgi:hypothetical protein